MPNSRVGIDNPTGLLQALPGFSSIRGRFFYLGLGFLAYLAIVAWVAESFTHRVLQESSNSIDHDHQLNSTLDRILLNAWDLEHLLLFDAGERKDLVKLDTLAAKIFADLSFVQRLSDGVPKEVKFSTDKFSLSGESMRATLNAAIATKDFSDQQGVRSAFENLRRNAYTLSESIHSRSLGNVADLAHSSERINGVFQKLTVAGVVLVLVAYLVLYKLILLPVARLVRLLDAEARGEALSFSIKSPTVETTRLLHAFNDLRDQIKSKQGRLQTILDNAAEAIITTDERGYIESFSRSAEKLFGFNSMAMLGKNINILLPEAMREQHKKYMAPEAHQAVKRIIGAERELVAQRENGEVFPVSLKITTTMLGGKKVYIALVADISDRKAMMDHLRFVAERDTVTGLFNRAYFQKELQKAVEKVNAGRGHRYSLLYVDLDNFKYVNDTLGHAAGDRLLMEVVNILKQRVRRDELIARFGGDEFTILLQCDEDTAARNVAESFREMLAERSFVYESKHNNIQCSIGVAMVCPGLTAYEILSRADLACHLAKKAGRNRVHVFAAEDAHDLMEMSHDMGWSKRIKDAVTKDRLLLACQPIVDTHTQEVYTYEVLVRMLDEDGGQILPGGFMPSAERFGQASDIDKWVIVNAIDKLVELQQRYPNTRFSINLSGQSLSDHSVLEMISGHIRSTGINPSSLIFEITETLAIADMVAANEILSGLQNLGCDTALDDFGAGMSSFAYLKDLPVNYVKIDGKFVQNLHTNQVDQAMVKAMSEVAHALGKKVVAEFVENAESYNLLASYGVDLAQGYYFGRPQIIDEKTGAGISECKTKTA